MGYLPRDLLMNDGFVRRDDIIEAMRKVKRSITNERMAEMPPFAPDDRVSIRLKSGAEIAHEPVVRPKGHWQKPLSEAELREKFLDCTDTRLGKKQPPTAAQGSPATVAAPMPSAASAGKSERNSVGGAS